MRAREAYLAAAAIGLGSFVAVYGAAHLLGVSDYWQNPEQDERMALVGYRYFLEDSWHWPVFSNDAINVPYSKSVAFLDCIPIWALINKSIATIVPPWKAFSADAYLGLWHGLTYALQACFGAACLRALGHRSWRASIVSALFFVAVPTWIFRYPHPALSAHWILLWAFCLYLRTPAGGTSSRLGWAKVAQLVVAALVTPYLAAMSLPVFVASLLRSRDRHTIALWLPAGLASVLLANAFAGYFAAEAAGRQWGFEKQSANLLGWLIPQRSAILGDAQWIISVNGTEWQYEGYSYLGLGILGLLVACAPYARHVGRAIARHRWLFVVVLGAALFALSNHIFFGPHEVLGYPVPRFLRWITGQFRSPGRFVWIPTYGALILALHLAFTQYATWRRFAIIAALALVQFVDATGEWAVQRAKTSRAFDSWIDREGWRSLVHAHDAMFALPSYGCGLGDNIATEDHVAKEIQFIASDAAIPINGTYSTRDQRQCAVEQQQWATLEPVDNALYVVFAPARAVADRLVARGLRCGRFEHGRVCSTNAGAIERAIERKTLVDDR